LLDATDADFTYTAFHYQVEKHNNVTSSAFKLDRYDKQLSDIGDNFQLTRAGAYRQTVDSSAPNFTLISAGVDITGHQQDLSSFSDAQKIGGVVPLYVGVSWVPIEHSVT